MPHIHVSYISFGIYLLICCTIPVKSSTSVIEKIVDDGSDTEIPCNVGFSHSFEWQKNGHPIQSNNRVWVSDTGNLVIKRADVSDAGDYTCHKKNHFGNSLQFSVHLVVKGCGSVSPDKRSQNRLWNAGIFLKVNSEYIYICSGTLISPYAVISDSSCVRNANGKLLDKNSLFITLGKKSRSYIDSHDEHAAQYAEVADYTVQPHEKGVDHSSQIVVLELKVAVRLTQFVQPACFDHTKRNQLLSDISNGIIVGDDHASKYHPLVLSYLSKSECEGYILKDIPEDTFCARSSLRSYKNISLRKDYSGTGLVFQVENKNYLFGGIYGSYRVINDFQTYFVGIFYDITFGRNLKFLQETLTSIRRKRDNEFYQKTKQGNQFSLENPKPLPSMSLPNQGSYEFGNPVQQPALKKEEIENIRTSSSLKDKIVIKGSDVEIVCGIMESSSQSIVWYKDHKPISTRVSVTENKSLMLENVVEGDTGHYACQLKNHNGKVRQSAVYLVVNDCGLTSPIDWRDNIQDANKIKHPWNAGLYVAEEGKYIYLCGGTLISQFAVLTAAHCVVQYGRVSDKNQLLVAVGKSYREYGNSNDNISAQYFEVADLSIPSHYDGETVSYYSDIAVIELKSAVKLTRFVKLACIDFSNKFQLASNSIGSIGGWDKNRRMGIPGTKLQVKNLSYISYNNCKEALKKLGITYNLAKDKFCAGSLADQNEAVFLDEIDSGSGLLFENDSRKYVVGVVSTAFKTENSDFLTFCDTKYPVNLDFINTNLQNIRRKHDI